MGHGFTLEIQEKNRQTPLSSCRKTVRHEYLTRCLLACKMVSGMLPKFTTHQWAFYFASSQTREMGNHSSACLSRNIWKTDEFAWRLPGQKQAWRIYYSLSECVEAVGSKICWLSSCQTPLSRKGILMTRIITITTMQTCHQQVILSSIFQSN